MLNKMNALIFSLVLSVAGIASAETVSYTEFFVQQAQEQIAQNARGLNWAIGDTANYSVDMGFLKGTMNMLVREKVTEGFWIQQDVDLGFAGKQKIEMLVDPDTGEVKKVLANGQEQQIPENDSEVVDVTQETITVPAGTFECLHATLKDKENKESHAWINPQLIPVMGMLKQTSPSQFGTVTMLLTSFKKN